MLLVILSVYPQHRCFGVVVHPQDSFGYSCLVFAELDSAQPVTSVVNFVQKVMREHKLANRHAQK